MSNAEETTEITLAEALKLTGFSRSTFYGRIRDGAISPLPVPPGFKKRPVALFRRADVLALLKG